MTKGVNSIDVSAATYNDWIHHRVKNNWAKFCSGLNPAISNSGEINPAIVRMWSSASTGTITKSNSLSTLSQKVRLWQKSATVAEFGDSLTFLRQCGQGLRHSTSDRQPLADCTAAHCTIGYRHYTVICLWLNDTSYSKSVWTSE